MWKKCKIRNLQECMIKGVSERGRHPVILENGVEELEGEKWRHMWNGVCEGGKDRDM